MATTRGTEDDFTGGGVDGRIPDKESGPPFDDDECLVIRMDVKTRASAQRVGPVSQHGDLTSDGESVHGSAPRSVAGRIEQPRLRGRAPIRFDRSRVEII